MMPAAASEFAQLRRKAESLERTLDAQLARYTQVSIDKSGMRTRGATGFAFVDKRCPLYSIPQGLV